VRDRGAHLSHPALENILGEGVRFVVGEVFGNVLGGRQPRRSLVFAIAGCGFSWGITGLSTLVQARAPDELRGRIMALWLVGFVGSRPVASTLLGSTADMVSVRAAFVVAAFVTLVVALLCRPRLLMRSGPVPLLQ